MASCTCWLPSEVAISNSSLQRAGLESSFVENWKLKASPKNTKPWLRHFKKTNPHWNGNDCKINVHSAGREKLLSNTGWQDLKWNQDCMHVVPWWNWDYQAMFTPGCEVPSSKKTAFKTCAWVLLETESAMSLLARIPGFVLEKPLLCHLSIGWGREVAGTSGLPISLSCIQGGGVWKSGGRERRAWSGHKEREWRKDWESATDPICAAIVMVPHNIEREHPASLQLCLLDCFAMAEQILMQM